jgi:hypothetical protein
MPIAISAPKPNDAKEAAGLIAAAIAPAVHTSASLVNAGVAKIEAESPDHAMSADETLGGGTKAVTKPVTVAEEVAYEKAKTTLMKPKGVTIKEKQAKAVVVVKHADGTSEEAAEAIGKPVHFIDAACSVEAGASYRMGMPNFSSAEVTVKITIPCAHAEIDETYKFAMGWVDERLSARVADMAAAKDAQK